MIIFCIKMSFKDYKDYELFIKRAEINELIESI